MNVRTPEPLVATSVPAPISDPEFRMTVPLLEVFEPFKVRIPEPLLVTNVPPIINVPEFRTVVPPTKLFEPFNVRTPAPLVATSVPVLVSEPGVKIVVPALNVFEPFIVRTPAPLMMIFSPPRVIDDVIVDAGKEFPPEIKIVLVASAPTGASPRQNTKRNKENWASLAKIDPSPMIELVFIELSVAVKFNLKSPM